MPSPIAIVGPTAVGKSWLALELAEAHGGEIVSADALQAYRGFDIGTAKPSAEERARVPHHLIDILDPDEPYSAGEFARRARRELVGIAERGRPALIVGGSGLYLRALLEGISPIPDTEPETRVRLRAELRAQGIEALRARLEHLDPVTAARLEPGDTQRIVRALEVAESTGRPLSAWLAREPVGEPPVTAARAGLTLPRALLYDRISERVRVMIQSGWVAEVEDLLARGLTPELPAFQAIGYRELAAYLRGETTLEQAREAIVRATRRFAKRQMTWFRGDEEVRWFSIENPRHCLAEVERWWLAV